MKKKHQINPDYYQRGSIEVIDVIEKLKLGTHESHVLKYIARWRHKHASTTDPKKVTAGMIADLEKARWWIDRLIKQTRNRAKK